MTQCGILAALLAAATTHAADLTKLDRAITKEPAYATKLPRYALLVFGPEAKQRVWIVKDGDTLHVDRNGNGDLTDPGERVAAKKGASTEDGHTFEVGDFAPGGTKVQNLNVTVRPLKYWLFGDYAARPDIQAAAKKDLQADTLSVSLESSLPHLRAKGMVFCMAGAIDLDGPLCLGAKPADAPVVHFGGPLEITFYSSRPTLRRNRASELIFVVGTRGLGAGTFAMLGYNETMPGDAHPVGEFNFASPKAGGAPVKKRFEFKERC